MTLRERVGLGRRKPQVEVKTPSTPKQKLSAAGLGTGFLELFSPNLQSEKTASKQLIQSYYGWVYANVSAIAEEVSKINPELYSVGFKGGEVTYTKIDEHPLLDLLDKFNTINTASEAFYLISANLELVGDAFLLKNSPGIPTEMYLLDPTCITVNPKDDGFGVANYEYKRTVNGKTYTDLYAPELIVHIKTPNPENPLRGKSTVAAAAASIDTASLAQEFLKSFFKNGAIVNFALTTEQRITPDELRRIEKQLKHGYGGALNAFKTLILGGGFDVKQVQHTNKDMEILQLETAMRDKIMAMFKNTKTSLGIVEDVNRANAEATLASWKASVIRPKIMRIIDSLNEYLTPLYGKNLILGFEDPVPENTTEKVTQVVALAGNSHTTFMTVNEMREWLDLAPLPDPKYDEIAEPPAPAAFGQNPNDPKQQDQGKRMPKALRHVKLQAHFRRQGLYTAYDTYKGLYEAARGLATKLVKSKASGEPEAPKPQKYRSYDDATALDFWQKQMSQVETVEHILKQRIDQYLLKIEDKAITALAENANKSGKLKVTATKADLVDEEAEVQSAIDLFTPLLDDIAKLTGVSAYELMNISRVYSPTAKMQATIKQFTELMANSVVGTDSNKLELILSDGLKEGHSIAEIEQSIRSEFGDFRKFQSERIARTEVLRASNAGALDAYNQSGVVDEVQWLCAPDCNDECLDYDGQVERINGAFFEADYGSGDQPPLHVNCRCTLIPVV